MANGGTSDALATAVSHAAETVDECLKTAISSFEAASGDAYDTDRWAKDMATLWACGVKGWVRAAADLTAVAAALAEDQDEGKSPADGGSGSGTAGPAAEAGPGAGSTT
jgi:hypothetical protein